MATEAGVEHAGLVGETRFCERCMRALNFWKVRNSGHLIFSHCCSNECSATSQLLTAWFVCSKWTNYR